LAGIKNAGATAKNMPKRKEIKVTVNQLSDEDPQPLRPPTCPTTLQVPRSAPKCFEFAIMAFDSADMIFDVLADIDFDLADMDLVLADMVFDSVLDRKFDLRIDRKFDPYVIAGVEPRHRKNSNKSNNGKILISTLVD
jgi:hypothetical protein